MEKKESWFMILLTGVGIGGFIYSLSLPLMGPAALSPGLFPGFVSSLMTVLGIVRFIQILRQKKEEPATAEESGEDGEGSRNIFVIIGLFLLYLLMLNSIHFLTSTLLFLFASMLFLYRKFYWKIPLISLLTTAGIFGLFRYLLNVRLP
jgi:hypothetical protein